MVALAINILILSILILILLTLFLDEQRLKTANSLRGAMTEYWDSTERRSSVRVNSSLQTIYSIKKRPRQSKDSRSKNISDSGILIQLSEKLCPSTVLSLQIKLPGLENPITAEGEIIWVKEVRQKDKMNRRLFDTGIKFISMDPKDKERLDKHIRGSL